MIPFRIDYSNHSKSISIFHFWSLNCIFIHLFCLVSLFYFRKLFPIMKIISLFSISKLFPVLNSAPVLQSWVQTVCCKPGPSADKYCWHSSTQRFVLIQSDTFTLALDLNNNRLPRIALAPVSPPWHAGLASTTAASTASDLPSPWCCKHADSGFSKSRWAVCNDRCSSCANYLPHTVPSNRQLEPT